MKRSGATILILAGLLTACGGLTRESASKSAQEPSRAEMTQVAVISEQVKEAGWNEVLETIDGRVVQWQSDVGVASMETQELADVIDVIISAINQRESAEDEWLVTRELFARVEALCVRLPADHPYRGGEYCA
jgi:hypothetical protein